MTVKQDNEIPYLHDAVLTNISIDPKAEAIAISVTPVRRETTAKYVKNIHVTRFTSIVYPNKQPWGPSNFINRVKLIKNDDTYELGIEMQSGDEIKILAENISFDEK